MQCRVRNQTEAATQVKMTSELTPSVVMICLIQTAPKRYTYIVIAQPISHDCYQGSVVAWHDEMIFDHRSYQVNFGKEVTGGMTSRISDTITKEMDTISRSFENLIQIE